MARSPPNALVPPRLHCSLRASKNRSNNNVPVMTTLRSLWEGLRRCDAIVEAGPPCCPGTGGCSESLVPRLHMAGPRTGRAGLASGLPSPATSVGQEPVTPGPPCPRAPAVCLAGVCGCRFDTTSRFAPWCSDLRWSRPTSRTCAPGPGTCRHGDHKCTPGLSGVSDSAGTREGKRPGDGRAEAAAPTWPQPGPARVPGGEEPISHRPAQWFQPEVTSGGSAGDRARLAWSAGAGRQGARVPTQRGVTVERRWRVFGWKETHPAALAR